MGGPRFPDSDGAAERPNRAGDSASPASVASVAGLGVLASVMW
jgi:hypothetical protein